MQLKIPEDLKIPEIIYKTIYPGYGIPIVQDQSVIFHDKHIKINLFRFIYEIQDYLEPFEISIWNHRYASKISNWDKVFYSDPNDGTNITSVFKAVEYSLKKLDENKKDKNE